MGTSTVVSSSPSSQYFYTSISPSLDRKESPGSVSKLFPKELERVTNFEPVDSSIQSIEFDVDILESSDSRKQEKKRIRSNSKESTNNTSKTSSALLVKATPLSIGKQLNQLSSLLNTLNKQADDLPNLDMPPNSQGMVLKAVSKLIPLGIINQYADVESAIKQYNESKTELQNAIQLFKNIGTIEKSNDVVDVSVHNVSAAVQNYLNSLDRIDTKIKEQSVQNEYFQLTLERIQQIKATFSKDIDPILQDIQNQIPNLTVARNAAQRYIEYANGNTVILANIVWFCEFSIALGGKQHLSKEDLSQAFKQLLERGIPFPEDTDNFFNVLQSTFPFDHSNTQVLSPPILIKDDLSDLPSEVSAQLLSGSQSINQTFNEQHRRLTYQLEYIKFLEELIQSSVNAYKNNIKELEQIQSEILLHRNRDVLALKHFYKLLLRTEAVTEADKKTYSLFSSQNSDIDEALSDHLQRHLELEGNTFRNILEEANKTSKYNLNEIFQMNQFIYDHAHDVSQLILVIQSRGELTQTQFETLVQRLLLLKDYQNSLDKFIQQDTKVPTQLQKQLTEEIKQANTEHMLIVQLLDTFKKQKSTTIALEQTQEMLKIQSQTSRDLRGMDSKKQTEFKENQANRNLTIYNLHIQLLDENIEATLEHSKALQKPEPIEARRNIAINFGNYLINDAHLSFEEKFQRLLKDEGEESEDLTKYRLWVKDQTIQRNEIEKLNISFRKQLLYLQLHLQKEENAVFPKDVTWSAWLMENFRPRRSIQEIEKQRWLALQGKTLTDAYRELARLITLPEDFDLANNYQEIYAQLKNHIIDFAYWVMENPTLAENLVGDINHFFNILNAQPFGIGAEITLIFNTALQRATIQNTVADALRGTRPDIRGLKEPAPPPSPAMIALLHMMGYLPYIAGITTSVTGGNLSGRFGPLIAGLLPIQVPGLTFLFQALLGVAEVKGTQNMSQMLTERRDLEVTINALLKAINGDFTYLIQRNKIQAAGTIVRDIFEGGKTGPIKRLRQEAALWWKHSTLKNKLTLAAIAIVAPVAITATVLGFLAAALGSLGVIPVLIAVFLGLSGGTLLTPILWRFFSRILGLDTIRHKINQEINHIRIDEALEAIKKDERLAEKIIESSHLEKLREALQIKLAQIKKDDDRTNLSESQMEELNQEIGRFFTDQAIADWVKKAMKDKNIKVKNPETFFAAAREMLNQQLAQNPLINA